MQPTAVQAQFQTAFERWGRPQTMRFDNGQPWGHPGSRVPTGLALWLVGAGIRLVFGRPRQSTDNAVVERSHGVLNTWVEPDTCANRLILEQRLSYFADLQRTRYPTQGGLTRQTRFPQLETNDRTYQRDHDAQLWELTHVLAYVATFTFTRRVEKNGRMTLMTHEYSVGRAYRGQQVSIQLDPQHVQWVIRDRQGAVIGQFAALQLNSLTLRTLQLNYRRAKSKLDRPSAGV